MLKIVLINHSFQKEYYSRRWKLFAESHKDVDITLLTPQKFKWYSNKAYTYTGGEAVECRNVDEDNFHIRTFQLRFKHSWCSDDFKPLLLEIKPDIVYHIGTHTQLSLVQIGRIVEHYLPQTKLMLFSMRGPALPKPKTASMREWARRAYMSVYRYFVTKYVNRHYNAVFCHYPDAVESFRKEGYKGPIYMQTQVGVNQEWFFRDDEKRQAIREKYNLGNAFVFGSATRFSSDKGLDDIIDALPEDGNWKFLMMGTGSESDIHRIKSKIIARGLQDKIILTGFVDWFEISAYWNAIDCAVHVPRTTSHWVETFSLSAVQPMMTCKPIIGNTSGSVPYQIGPDGIIVEEGNIKALHDKLVYAIEHPEEMVNLGKKMYERASTSFSVQHLNELFYLTIIEDVMKGKYDDKKSDMSRYETK